MDLVYMPEVLSYGSLRHPQYRDYEQPWNKDYFNYGKSTTKTRSHQQRQQVQKPAVKTPCPLCKENKRRTLAAYIRGKARNNSCSEIHEEVEEVDEEEEEIDEDREELARREGKAEDNKTVGKKIQEKETESSRRNNESNECKPCKNENNKI